MCERSLELSEDNHFQQGVQEMRKQVQIRDSDLSSHKGRGKNRKIRQAEPSADYLAFGWLEKQA